LSSATSIPNWPAKLTALLLLLPLGPGLGALAGAGTESEEPPVVGQPAYFSGLVGRYQIAASATPTEVNVEDSLTLTITITQTSAGTSPRFMPRRETLRVFPASVERDFYVQALPDTRMRGPKVWTFAYRLKPKREDVTRIPALRLSYFDPRVNKYQVAYSRSIGLRVRPRPQMQPPANEVTIVRAPERIYELVTGPAVLQPAQASERISAVTLAVLLLVPPLLCGGWYLAWRHFCPDAARRARWHRSRAAQHALQRLRGLARAGSAEGSAAVVADYLRQSLALSTAEPTPAEALSQLHRAHVPPPLAARVAQFLRACDAGRFAPEPLVEPGPLPADAEAIILALEAEPCLSRHS
jgi:BatD DUF11 like domain